MLQGIITSVCQYVNLNNVQKTKIDFEVVFTSSIEHNRLESVTLLIKKNATQEDVDTAIAGYLAPLNEALQTQ